VPRYSRTEKFILDYKKLTQDQREAFRVAVRQFIGDLEKAQGFARFLRVKPVQGKKGVWELSWGDDCRATWQYADDGKPGDPHIIWRRIGTHSIFKNP
jgi:hypothetical protein